MSTFLRVVNPTEPCVNMPETLATEYKFPLDNFQMHAIAAISNEENVLVTAKTGSGKTLVGEYQIAHSLAKSRRVFYTTPIKSLSNQKFHDLKKMYPGRVGILTGDIKFQPDADIIVMTTEILRNLLYKKGSATENVGLTAGMSLDGLDAVVFDEVHYINNKERGKVWEETLILLPPEVNLVLLSATIAQPEAFASWLGDLKQKPIHLISTTYRIVPLTHNIIEWSGQPSLKPIMSEKEKFLDQNYRIWLQARDKIVDDHRDHKQRVAGREKGQVIGAEQGKVKIKSFVNQLNSTIRFLYEKELLPALFFIFSRKDCERYATQVEGSLVDTSDAAAIGHIFDFHLSRYKETLMSSPQYHTLRALLVRGIAFHHSGLQPILKEIIEILFEKGLVRVMFCTETFAVGINMPTKTVVFLDLKKYDDENKGRRCLNTDEYIQMAGRAGRRGKDKTGTVIYLPRDEPLVTDELKKMMTGGNSKISSRMDFGYDFIMKTLLHSSSSGDVPHISWKTIMNDSLWYKQLMDSKQLVQTEIAELESKRAIYSLTGDDVASLEAYYEKKSMLGVTVKEYRARLQREIGDWENKHVGPRWANILKGWPQLSVKMKACKEELEEFSEGFEDRLVAPHIDFLKGLGFIAEDGCALTEKGRCATEVNEAHPILVTEAYFRGWLDGLSAEDLIGFLGAFASDGSDVDESPSLNSMRITPALRSLFSNLQTLTGDCYEEEQRRSIITNDYWDISTFWVEPAIAWIKGASVANICSEYAIFEGNLYKFVMSLSNMIDELTSVATLRSDVEMLEKLVAVKNLVIAPGKMSWGESLYLRL